MSQCVICMETLEKKFCQLSCNCNSSYHLECINKWLELNKKCPTCNKLFKNRSNSNEELLKQAIFYDSIGSFNIFRRQYLFVS